MFSAVWYSFNHWHVYRMNEKRLALYQRGQRLNDISSFSMNTFKCFHFFRWFVEKTSIIHSLILTFHDDSCLAWIEKLWPWFHNNLKYTQYIQQGIHWNECIYRIVFNKVTWVQTGISLNQVHVHLHEHQPLYWLIKVSFFHSFYVHHIHLFCCIPEMNSCRMHSITILQHI